MNIRLLFCKYLVFFLLTLGFYSIRKLFLSDKPLKQSSLGHLQINASAGFPCSNSFVILLFSLLPTLWHFCLFSILVFSTNKFFFLFYPHDQHEILLKRLFFPKNFPFHKKNCRNRHLELCAMTILIRPIVAQWLKSNV